MSDRNFSGYRNAFMFACRYCSATGGGHRRGCPMHSDPEPPDCNHIPHVQSRVAEYSKRLFVVGFAIGMALGVLITRLVGG